MALNPGTEIYYGEIQQQIVNFTNQRAILQQQADDIAANIDELTNRINEGQKTLNFLDDGSPVLPTPTNFTSTQALPTGTAQVDLQWDDDVSVTNWVIDRANDPNFTIGFVNIFSGIYTSVLSDSSIVPGNYYYYRVKGEAAGFIDSLYAYTEIQTVAS